MSGKSTETEVLAQELDTLGNQLRAVETRLAEVEKIIEGLEAAALTTARAFLALGQGVSGDASRRVARAARAL
jgi:prefoldin subunit 5